MVALHCDRRLSMKKEIIKYYMKEYDKSAHRFVSDLHNGILRVEQIFLLLFP